jgi:excisionase family DNA binding protein
VTTDGRPSWHHDDMLTVTDAARIAQRSARTIRRAYLSGRLVAHRDGNGRGIRIHYGDLRAWMLAELVAPRSEPTSSELMARVDLKGSRSSRQNTGNLELLSAVRRRRSRRARASATAQPPRGSAGSGNA